MTRIALITGASRGLGRALSHALAAKGWVLVLTARGAEALQEVCDDLADKTWVQGIPGDVADPLHRARLAEAVRSLGGLDLLVNNAAILGPSPRPQLLDFPLDELERVCRINALAPLAMVQDLRDLLRPGACVVNVSSDAAPDCYEGWGGYGASKAMLDHLSGTLALENPQWRIYWVDPGEMRTQLFQESCPGENLNYLHPPEVSVPAFLDLIEGHKPSGRYFAQDAEALYPSL
ncbi:SDR family oxidoreductase [bacterium]|nr:SDR family oxidoreductase [bacterium]